MMRLNLWMGSWTARPATGLAALLVGMGLCGATHAQSALPDYESLAQSWLNEATSVSQSTDAAPLRIEVKIGNLDSRLRLAPCANIEPYLPPGTRLWGRSRMGLRCVDGISRWNVSLPVTINAYGSAWVVKGNIQAGASITEDDVVEDEVNWAEDSRPVLRDPALWLGQTATRTLTTGQALRQGMVRPTQVFLAGAQVRVIAMGGGFQIAADAQALSAGVVGQSARVRMENGRVSTGTVLDMRTVKIEL